MENQSPASSTNSSSPPKHDQKLKSVVVSEEEGVTMKPKSPQEVVSERTILEKPRFILETVRTVSDEETYLCDICRREFPSRRSVSAHQKFHRKEQELKRQRILFGSKHSDDAYLGPSDSYEGLSLSRFRYGGGDSSSSSRPYLFSTGEGVKQMETTMFPPHALDRSLTGNPSYSTSHAFSNDEDHINLDLTLGPSKPIGGSSNSIKNIPNSYLDMEATRRTTNLFGPVCPRVRPFNFVAGNTNPCHELFFLQGNGMGSSHPERLFSTGVDSKAMVPPFAPPYPTSTNICHDLFSLQENGLGSGQSKSLISKGKNKVMVPDDDDDDDDVKDLELRWLTKKKRSRQA